MTSSGGDYYTGWGETAGEQATGDTETFETMIGDTSLMYIVIYTYDTTGTYEFDLAVESQNDAGSGGDVTDSCDEGSYELTEGGTYSGHIGGEDGADRYVVQLDKGQSITVDITPQSDLDIEAGSDEDCNDAWSWETDEGLQGDTETLSATAEEDRFFYWIISRKSGAEYGTYDMQVTIE